MKTLRSPYQIWWKITIMITSGCQIYGRLKTLVVCHLCYSLCIICAMCCVLLMMFLVCYLWYLLCAICVFLCVICGMCCVYCQELYLIVQCDGDILTGL